MSDVDSTPFFSAGGALPVTARCYIPRQADASLFASLMRGEFSYVLVSRQMGKSSLMVRTAARLRREGVTAIVLDLNRGGNDLDREQWYYGLMMEIARKLNVRIEIRGFWAQADGLG